MKTLYSIIFLTLVSFLGYSQVPEAFNYQAVMRNASGDILTNAQIAVQISILQDSESGTAAYVERFNPTTNDYGLIAIKLGKGTVQSGAFNTIDWGAHAHYIKVEVDPNNGTDFTTMGTTQLLSVPYALYAKSGGDDDADADATNELQTISKTGNTVTLSNGGGTFTDDVDDADADPLNEIQTLSVTGTDLSISDGNTVPLPPPANNTITSDMIMDGEVKTDDIATDAVTSDKIDDGAGSGLDADLLDGQQGSYYRDAANINSGPLGNAYFSAYGDLMAEGYLNESSATDLVTLGQAESRYAIPKVAFYAYNSTSDAITGSSAWHDVEFDTELFDDGNDYNNITDRFIVPVDGVYHFTAKVGTTPTINATGLFILGITINGGDLKLQNHYSPTTDNHEECHNGSITYKLNAGDQIGVSVYTSFDAAFTIAGGNYSTSFCGYLIYAD